MKTVRVPVLGHDENGQKGYSESQKEKLEAREP
jgi:hypothetical protein